MTKKAAFKALARDLARESMVTKALGRFLEQIFEEVYDTEIKPLQEEIAVLRSGPCVTIEAPFELQALLAKMKAAKSQEINMAVWNNNIKAVADAIATIEHIRRGQSLVRRPSVASAGDGQALVIESEMHSATTAWLECPIEKRPSAEALGKRIADIASGWRLA